jgi:hypothetical protein
MESREIKEPSESSAPEGIKEPPESSTVEMSPLPPVGAGSLGAGRMVPQACSSCGSSAAARLPDQPVPVSYVYALGKIETRFPRLSVEKEFVQATSRAETKGLTDRQALHSVLSKPENRYLVRQLCWVMTIEGLEAYILVPRDPADSSLLVDTLRPNPAPADLDLVVGVKGPIASPEICNGLMVPIVVFDQIYSFDRGSLMKAIPRPEKVKAEAFAPAAEELFDRIMQWTGNAGATDEHRALNYLAVRYPGIYAAVAEAFTRDASLSAVNVRSSPLSGTRKVLEVILSFTNRNTDVVEKSFARVDVTEEFPFLVTKLSPYYDR